MVFLHRDVWGSSHGNVLKAIGGRIVLQRFRMEPKGLIGFTMKQTKGMKMTIFRV